MSFAVVIPVSNEESTLESFIQKLVEVRRLSTYKFEVFFIWDDSSTDRTSLLLQAAQKHHSFIKSIYYQNSHGVVSCYLYGLKLALKRHIFAVEMDSGHSHPPEHLPEIFEKLERGHDCVFMSRFLQGSKIIGMPWWRKFISKLGTTLPKILLNLKYTDTVGGYKGFRLDSIKHALEYPHYVPGSGWQIQMKVLCHHLRWVELAYTYRASQSTFQFKWVFWAIVGLARIHRELKTQGNS